ncbi:unnamed protein product [Pseudo-nitzschia multistriata]|uniref:ADP,ATP carrier protein n=1 Tax=Pseudo-nitzschia multistriata TaxID=183589 RepID=A0A448Z8F7_9STRA|nr:unnamed protein product [Pseudo-nitzschia multistriata]
MVSVDTLDKQEEVRLMASDSLSKEEEDDAKGGDTVSLSTCSMSTNPNTTPENPLFAASYKSGGGIAPNFTEVAAQNCSSRDGIDGVIGSTKRLTIADDNYNCKISDNNDHSSCLPRSVVTTAALHEDFHKSPEPVPQQQVQKKSSSVGAISENNELSHNYHMLHQIQESRTNSQNDGLGAYDGVGSAENMSPPVSPIGISRPIGEGVAASPIGASFLLRRENKTLSDDSLNSTNYNGCSSKSSSPTKIPHAKSFSSSKKSFFIPHYGCTRITYAISRYIFDDTNDDYAVATWLGFWALFNVSCANYILKPIMDSIVLQLGVENLASLTFAGTILSFLSSVPIGWLFEAPDPKRRKVFKKMGMTRGETQGTSLALFYRFFALSALSYAVGFQLVDWVRKLEWIKNYVIIKWIFGINEDGTNKDAIIPFLLDKLGQFMYVAFFLLVTLMTRHSTSLVWGVTTEAMEYEEIARKQHGNPSKPNKTQLERLNRIQFGATIGGIWGSVLASSLAKILHLPGLLVVSAFLLEISAELSIELGRIMEQHWEEQIRYRSNQDLTSLDSSMKRSSSVGSMKRVASGNSIFAAQQAQQQQQAMKRVASGNSIHSATNRSSGSLSSMANTDQQHAATTNDVIDDNTFWQRLFRGITTILDSYLLMTIFTYNALFSSTTTLLSFQRAELVANRKKDRAVDVSADTAFLARVNMGSSVAMFAIQSSGAGASITHRIGLRGSLALMPFIRLGSLICLCWWHRSTSGRPPNLILFLMLDEFTKIINLAVAKPVRESLWRGMSSEARYEAKPIIDVLANRWGAGSASVCVHAVSWVLLVLGQTNADNADATDPVVFGLPPVLFLGLIVSAWWVGVSLDLGDRRIKCDSELEQRKKNQ